MSACPYYISLGMTYDEYWNEEPERTVMYRKASYIKTEQENSSLWLQGVYIYDAFAKVISSAFGKGKSAKNRYMDKPIEILPKSDEQRIKEAQKQRDALERQLTAWANSFKG